MKLPLKSVTLEGDLFIPKDAACIVIFAHGSGSSRHSPRNKMVAEELNEAGIATLLFDLLTPEEDEVSETRFDIDLLTQRLIEVVDYLKTLDETKTLEIGFFGASTGAAAALSAAAILGQEVVSVVSRGGRPDLAGAALTKVLAPTLLIVGGNDTVVIELNETALNQLSCEKRLEIIEGASHLFEEPGTLAQVSRCAKNWFLKSF